MQEENLMDISEQPLGVDDGQEASHAVVHGVSESDTI